MQEKRRHRRVQLTIPVRLRCGASGPPASAEIADLSLGGCFVRVDQTPALGSAVELEIDLKRERRTVRMEGKVVHSLLDKRSHRGYGGIGIQFMHLKDDDVIFLAQVVARPGDYESGSN